MAVIMGIAFSAFTPEKKSTSSTTDLFWYVYNPSTNQIDLLPDGQNIARSEDDAVEQTFCSRIQQPVVCAKAYGTMQTGLPKTAPSSPLDQLYEEQ